jgi:Bacterial Ig-like domain
MKKSIGLSLARLFLNFVLVVPLLTACLTASLTVTPRTPTLTAGSSLVTVTAMLENASGTVLWELSGPGSIPSDSIGSTVNYTPPASVPGPSTATLTARLGTLSDIATITINPAPPPPDTTAPTIVSVTPANNAVGVAAEANIVVVFSERMNQAATQGAYNSGDLPSATFSWNLEGTVLTINPSTDLSYSGAGLDRIYHVSFNDSAKDSAGNALAAVSYSFRTLRYLSVRLESQAALDGYLVSDGFVDTTDVVLYVGDDSANRDYGAFLSFDLSTLPSNLRSINYASLWVYQEASRRAGNPYADNSVGGLSQGANHLRVVHANYGATLETSDRAAATFLGDLGGDVSSDGSGGLKSLGTEALLAAVQDDVTNRTSRGNRSQYALSFPYAANGDGSDDYIAIFSGNNAVNRPWLYLEYLVP